MPLLAPTRVVAVPRWKTRAPRPTVFCGIVLCGASLAGVSAVWAQSGEHQTPSGLPVSQPTAAPAQFQTASAAYAAPVASAVQRAQISYAGGQLTVSATNSSLNQILREISRQIGMKVTGGVTDERVFGTYGPAAPAQVLTTLLDGTGSNLLLVHSPGSQPSAPPVELVLTPRHGGPTPPNPNAPGFNDTPDPQTDISPLIQPTPRRGSPGPDQSQPVNASTPPPGAPPASTDTPGGPATTQDQSPNGVKTPQQIYEQLLRLRNQSQQPAPQ